MSTAATIRHRGPVADPVVETAWHTIEAADSVRRLRTSAAVGLEESEAARRLATGGPNSLVAAHGRSAFSMVCDQFKSLIVALLVGATVLALLLGEVVEGLAILVVLVVNGVIGFLTEWKARQALVALRAQAVPSAQVLRSGVQHEIAASELVTGDVVMIAAGSRVPADGRVLEATRLHVDEASLTGESLPVTKCGDSVPERDTSLGDRVNMVFLGTAIVAGRGTFVVTATGPRTEVGKIGKLVEQAGEPETPLERKLAQLGHVLIGVVLVLCVVIVAAGWLRGNNFLRMLEVGISLAIASVPEGLPAVATMTLALGMQRMTRMRALVRTLPAVETLGSTTVVCTDKTGTLTQNEMTVRVFQLGARRVDVSGTGYAPAGGFSERGQRVEPGADHQLLLAARIGALCSDARIEGAVGDGAALGDPTEIALLVAAGKAGLDHKASRRAFVRVAEVPFSSESMRMVTVHRTASGETVAYVKGAPAVLIAASTRQLSREGVRALDADGRQRLETSNAELAGQGMRVLALAYRDVARAYRVDDLSADLVFVGLVGMVDPLRDEARSAIATLRDAGVRTIMITGDQQATAAEVGRQLGLDHGPGGRPLRSVHDRELTALDHAGWGRVVAEAGVFARVSPEHKLKIVETLQAQGEVVAMTGDGINDAPALKAADIGIAMGRTGTEVAKEAADMVVTDDNFGTIVLAVEQGRSIYANILRFVHYLFSCNLAEILVVFVAILLGWPLPLAALQVLWLNMITDVFPAMALALEPASPEGMRVPPVDPREPLVSVRFGGLIAWQGALLAGVTLLAFRVAIDWYGTAADEGRHAVTVAFMTLALVQVLHTFNARSRRRSALGAGLFVNAWLWGAVILCLALQLAAIYCPALGRVLHTVPLAPRDWALIAVCAATPVAVIELVKLIGRTMARRAERARTQMARARVRFAS